ncbi:hypothetical protein BD626DRAFT_271391 [Schizophyllum amplum]|uniref:Uncharacterized protein n=1 Tax=Schizophyllum amplum TaxID=97359 RepID=A0A550CFE8_9AGAR|nr:hypothetical protein BD626DRAFT_271391 [Auriculariopsis ampla]
MLIQRIIPLELGRGTPMGEISVPPYRSGRSRMFPCSSRPLHSPVLMLVMFELCLQTHCIERYGAKRVIFCMWRRSSLVDSIDAACLAHKYRTVPCYVSSQDTFYEVLSAPSACAPHNTSPSPPRSPPQSLLRAPATPTSESLMTHSGGSNTRTILRRPPTAAQTRHRAYILSTPRIFHYPVVHFRARRPLGWSSSSLLGST